MMYVGDGAYNSYFTSTMQKLKDSKENALLNGNNLANLPDLQIGAPQYSTTCSHGAVYLGSNVTNPIYCKQVCGNDGHIIQIGKETTHFVNGVQLSEGSWCVTHDPVECNANTGYVLAGSNGATCRSRFPEIIGGDKANKIEACNDNIVNATNSVLMDNLHNEPVTLNTIITDVDEKLSNGSYRFTCKAGRDVFGNKYMIHPEARFHVIPDPCKESGARMHDSVGVAITDDGWHCDCGDFNTTRVKNLTSDPKSSCSSCVLKKVNNQIEIPYPCTTSDSTFDMLGVAPFCYPSKFISKGAECASMTLEMVQVNDEFDAPFSGVVLDRNKMDSQQITYTWPINTLL